MQKDHPVTLGTILSSAVAVGTPILSTWFTFVILSRLPILGSLIQRFAHPIVQLLPGIIVGLVLFFFSQAFAKHNEAGRHSLKTFGATALIASLVVLWFQLLISKPHFPVRQVAFNPTSWQRSKCGLSRTRQQMTDDLRTKIRGLSAAQVVTLIGHPEVGQMSYCLGPEPAMIPTDRLFMRVLFDSRSGKAVDIRISTN